MFCVPAKHIIYVHSVKVRANTKVLTLGDFCFCRNEADSFWFGVCSYSKDQPKEMKAKPNKTEPGISNKG